MTEVSRTRGRITFLLIAAVFFGPLIVAWWLYFQGVAFQPEGRVNHGALLEPIENVTEVVPGFTLPDFCTDDRSVPVTRSSVSSSWAAVRVASNTPLLLLAEPPMSLPAALRVALKNTRFCHMAPPV